ncbi:MAG: hypothetical protein IKJ13_03390 [Clostridia bacterium]|nr:hypothetical protein [Clostridia bacterium]
MKKFITENGFELLIELGALVVGIAIVCLFPLPIFEEWPELAMLIGAVLVVGVVGLVAMIIHLIKRKRK